MSLYRKIRYRKGFGVQSPFVFNLITTVIEEQAPFYAFAEIEQFRQQLLSASGTVAEVTARETPSAKTGAFLFRLAHFLHSRKIVVIGGSTGVMGLYLTMPSPSKTTCYLLEDRAELPAALRDWALARSLHGLHCPEGKVIENLQALAEQRFEADLIFIERLPETMDADSCIRLLRPLTGPRGLWVLNDLRRQPVMEQIWQQMNDSPEASVKIDLQSLGLVFFDKKLPQRQYKAYFNNGKKQNLHPHGRRGLHLFGRRKTSV
jgi:predicted O-methyltransferase YrrM